MSLDQIGSIAKTIDEATHVLDVIKGSDERDTTTFASTELVLKHPKKLTFGVIRLPGVDPRIDQLITGQLMMIANELGWSEKQVSMKYIDLAIQTYHPIVWTEFFSATRRLDGRRYGKKIEDSAGAEVLRRIIGGSEISKAEHAGQYYQKALAVKAMIKKEFERVLGHLDCIIMPTVAVLPWKFGMPVSLEHLYAVDALTIPSNLAEVCAVSIPIGTIDDGEVQKPVGVQVICGKGEEGKMLSIAKDIEKIVVSLK